MSVAGYFSGVVVHDIYLRISLTGRVLVDNLIGYAYSYGGSAVTVNGGFRHGRLLTA